MVAAEDSKSGIRKGVGVQVPPEAPTSFSSDEYNPLEWAQIMVKAKTIIGKPTSFTKEYNIITNDEELLN